MREASYALGKTRIATIRRVLLPSLRADIATGATLGMGRIIGTTAIVVLLLGASLQTSPQGPRAAAARVPARHRLDADELRLRQLALRRGQRAPEGVRGRLRADPDRARPQRGGRADLAPRSGHARVGREARAMNRKAEKELADSGLDLPVAYDAKVRLLESFSPKTLNDDNAVRDWIDMFTLWPTKPTPGMRAQSEVAPKGNRLPAYRAIATPTLVIGFADDLPVPPHLSKEVADALPNGRFLHIRDAGHLGFLERPQAVNAAILQFFADPAL